MTNEYQVCIPVEDLQNQSIKEFILNENRPFEGDEQFVTLYYDNFTDMTIAYKEYYDLITTIMELENLYCKEI